MLELDALEDDEDSRSRGGEPADEKDEVRAELAWRSSLGLSPRCGGEGEEDDLEGAGVDSFGRMTKDGQSLSFRIEKIRAPRGCV